ncbi:MAG: flagellin FliC [Polyangiaceae bacterium]|nr:flagellin FliC [Polyangiaceae bacterium]
MGLNIQTNVAALEAQRNVVRNQKLLQGSYNKLSSGFRVNTAADDAAGLAISESMKSQIRSYTVAERNAGDGISMAQTAEGALGEIHNVLGRMRELAMQASNGSLGTADRGYLDTEFKSLQGEISRIQGSTKFNGTDLITSDTASSVTFQVGLNDDANDQIDVQFNGIDLDDVVAGTTLLTGATTDNALDSLAIIDAAINTVSGARSSFGAAMNKLEVATNNIQTMRLNLSAANSRIRDVDMAEETSNLARNQVLAQAGTSILAQANQLPQLAFGLLGG